MKFHKITMEKTHNLEVPGSSPGWSTKRIAVAILFFMLLQLKKGLINFAFFNKFLYLCKQN